MTLTELRYLVAVARERHFGRAAESCFVSQPTLSVAIKKLEEELGIQVFERHVGDISLTPVGERVVEQAQRTLEEAERVRQIALQGKDQLSGPLRLGVIFTVAPYLLPRLIPALRDSAPHMPILVEENYTSRLTQQLKQGDLDVAILSEPYQEPGLVTYPLYDEPFRVAMPKGHPWEELDAIPGELLGEDQVLLLSAGNCFRDQVIDACPAVLHHKGEHGLSRAMEGSSLQTILHMVASGVGVTVVPASYAGWLAYPNSYLSVKPFADRNPTRRILLVTRKRFVRPQAVEAIRNAIRTAVQHGHLLATESAALESEIMESEL